MNHDDKLSGTLLVNCSGSACRRVIQDVSGGKDLIQKVEINIRKIDGVHSVSHEIGSSLLY
jgi:hypothetical protein